MSITSPVRTRRSPARPTILARLAVTSAMITALIGFPTSACADVTVATWTDAQHYDFHVNYMPDLDQKRVGLPGGGSMYCVPTASMNLFAYAAQWGFPLVPPGPGAWTAYDGYYEMTAYIDDLGVLMSTDAATGTDGSGWTSGVNAWLNGHPLVKIKYSRTPSWCPRVSNMALATSLGAIVSFCYGRYEYIDGFQGVPWATNRASGHCVTLSHAHAAGAGPIVLWSRDPGDDVDNDPFSQSPFANNVYTSCQTLDVGFDDDEDGSFIPLLVDVLNHPVGDGKIRVIDSYLAVFPAFGTAFTHVQLNFEQLYGDGWITTPPPTVIPIDADLELIDVQLHPELVGAIAVVSDAAGARSLRLANRVTMAWETLLALDPGAVFALSRHGEAYVAQTLRVERRGLEDPGTVRSIVSVPAQPVAVATDDETDEVWVLSATDRTLRRYSRDLATLVAAHPLPAGVPTGPDVELVSMSLRRGTAWVSVDDAAGPDFLVGLTPNAAGDLDVERILDPVIVSPTTIDGDPDGRLVVVCDGSVLAFLRDATGQWMLDPDAPYGGVAGAIGYRVAHSRTNDDPALHDTPGWNNIDPDELVPLGETVRDCPADFDGDGIVGLSDLLGVLSNWGGSLPLYDVAPGGGDGTIGFADLVEVLGTWGPCTPPG